ncbi:DUF2975 domain-containing protein [Mesobacillus foraminis]|uniref:DUF2975 domain-containing protein n=1 Tax=Mesobacillus foraminis TaxID=279826 RepID=UPI001BE69B79|nr:DUF2975 domain-containing protein [Mesobacillus foraminis]MBT2759219.1 DUF2975 domain-containing protein [Mesobacillus foraminis]
MKHIQGSTLFLKLVLFMIGIMVLVFCIFWVPGAASRDSAAHPETAYLRDPFLVCTYVLSIPLLVALYHTFILLTSIDKDKAFSPSSVKALKSIKYCAIAISVGIVAGFLFAAIVVGGDLAGIFMLALICTFASIVIGVFVNVLQKLLNQALEMKLENDFTICGNLWPGIYLFLVSP